MRDLNFEVLRALRRTVGLLAVALGLSACASGQAAPPVYHGDPGVRGSVAAVEPVGAYSALRMWVLLLQAKASVPVANGIDLYRVSYWSITDGKPVLVSGLMSVPGRGAPRGTVLWMHGTQDNRGDSISNARSEEAVAASGVFAGGGYLLLAPDLFGLGVSKGRQAYYFNPSTIDVTLDFLRAAKTVTRDLGRPWNPNIYVAGFSQGGHSAAVLQQELERRPSPEWRIRAGAGIAGAYKLADISIPFALNGHSPQDSDYLATAALSYATYYHRPLDEVLVQPYAGIVARLFDGDHTLEEISKAMPSNPRAMFAPAILAAFDVNAPSWFVDALRQNEIGGWAPRSPFRAYYGEKDVDVSPADARTLVAESKPLGGNIEAISVGPYDHSGTALRAAPLIRQWFDELSGRASPR